MKKNKTKPAPKLIAITIIILLALFFVIGYIWIFLRTSDYFKVKDIVIKDSKVIDLSYLKGKNIFSIDLEKESGYILEYFPDCSNVRLTRLLPDRLFVDFIKRRAFALVKLYRYFAVDRTGVFFYAPDQELETNLPVIYGLETKIFGPKPGKKYTIKELNLALDVIKQVRSNKAFRLYRIKKIDVANLDSISIFMSGLVMPNNYTLAQQQNTGIIEIKISQENIKEKIIFLAGLFNQSKNDLPNMKYIDLRFKEPVLKFNDVKTK